MRNLLITDTGETLLHRSLYTKEPHEKQAILMIAIPVIKFLNAQRDALNDPEKVVAVFETGLKVSRGSHSAIRIARGTLEDRRRANVGSNEYSTYSNSRKLDLIKLVLDFEKNPDTYQGILDRYQESQENGYLI